MKILMEMDWGRVRIILSFIEQDKEVRIINYSPLPSEYQYLNEDNIYEYYDSESHDEWIKDIDLVIVFDVGDF